jgi:Putative zinc binding domain
MSCPPNLACRFCGTKLSHTLVDLGYTPLANSYVDPACAAKPDPVYPLCARVCANCFLVQVEDAVPAEAIFNDYAYFSSYSASGVRPCGWTVSSGCFDRLPGVLVLELGGAEIAQGGM